MRLAKDNARVGQKMKKTYFLAVQNLTMSLTTALSSERLLNLSETVSYLYNMILPTAQIEIRLSRIINIPGALGMFH